MRPCKRRVRVVAAVTSLTLAAGFGVGACSDEEIVLAKVPEQSQGGAGNDTKRCAVDSECESTGFCARVRCGDVGGSCEARPVACGDQVSPVCGCDGVTYWNDCLRRAAGIASGRPGECPFDRARRCGDAKGGKPGGASGDDRCAAGTFCALLLPAPGACSPGPQGTCWALPSVCPTEGGGDRWIRCGGPGGAECTTTCSAIRSGEPHLRASSCP